MKGITQIADLTEKETDASKQLSKSEIIEQRETPKLISDIEELWEHETKREQMVAIKQKLFLTSTYFYGVAIITLILIWHYIIV